MSVEEVQMLKNSETAAVSCLTLLEDFNQGEQPRDGKLLRFIGTGRKDAYNCAIEMIDGERVLASRIESRPNALDAETRFYRERPDGAWEKIPNAPVFAMEDPAIELIGKEIIVSGVRVQWKKNKNGKHKLLGFHTLFYRGERLEDLHLFAEGPRDMKDIRLLELPDGRIAVFTRPQKGEAGLGKIAFTIIDSLEEISPQRLLEAMIIPGQFANGEWGGTNKLYLFDKKTIGVLGHIAFKDEKKAKHYYAMTFRFNFETRTASLLRIIAERKNFPASSAKKPWLRDVVFPGGLLKEDRDRFILYTGLSDAMNGTTIIVDPFGMATLRAAVGKGQK